MRYAKMPDSSSTSEDSAGSGSEAGSVGSHSGSSGSSSESEEDTVDDEYDKQLAILLDQFKKVSEQIQTLQNSKAIAAAKKEKKKKRKSSRIKRIERNAKTDDFHLKKEDAFDGTLNAANMAVVSVPGVSGQFSQSGFMSNDASLIGGNLGIID